MLRFKFFRLLPLLVFLTLSSCGFVGTKDFISLVLLKNEVSLKTRLKEFKNKTWNVRKPVEIHWDKHAIPFIKAKTDRDLFYATGVVQAHLRGAQLEIFRRLSQGRLSELVGAKTIDMDIFLRTIDVGAAHKEMIQSWPEEIRLQAKAFINGINDYNRQITRMPIDLKIMGVHEIEPWTLKELVYIHRLMGTDVNWKFWPKLVKVYNDIEEDEYSRFWQKWLKPLFQKKELELSFLDQFKEAGSNAYAISGKRTNSGKPIVAGDPHLGLTVPNFWLFMHQESPSFKTLGIAMPSFPVAAMGKNKHIAWTGTNMWGLSSYLYEVSEEDLKTATVRKERFKLRFGKDREVDVLQTAKGPILTNTKFLKSDKPLALYWVGHRNTSEFESLYKANQAQTVEEFKTAFKGYGVVALNYVVADKDNNISKIHVTQFPKLKTEAKRFIQKPDNTVEAYYNVFDFPEDKNPDRGFVVSSNEHFKVKNRSVCWFCSLGERLERISSILESSKSVDVETVKKIQTDVFYKDAKIAIDKLFKIYGDKKVRLPDNFQTLLDWDLYYTVESKGAHYFEEVLKNFAFLIHEEAELSAPQRKLAFEHYSWRLSIFDKFESLSVNAQKETLKALTVKMNKFRIKPWGDVHKIDFKHNFGSLPLIGRFFKLINAPYPGSSATVFKAAFKSGAEGYTVGFGANLRIIFDLSNDDKNYGILLGGQDGFWGSEQSKDQIDMWLKGEYIKLPFGMDASASAETVFLR